MAELLSEFFQYFAWHFDYTASVVSLSTGRSLPKIKKAEVDGWPQHERIRLVSPVFIVSSLCLHSVLIASLLLSSLVP